MAETELLFPVGLPHLGGKAVLDSLPHRLSLYSKILKEDPHPKVPL